MPPIDDCDQPPQDLEREILQQFMSQADFWAWQSDAEHRITYLSERFDELTGFKASDFVGQSRLRINNRNASKDIWLEHKKNLDKRQAFKDFRYPVDKPDVEACWFDSSGTPQFDATGKFIGYRGTARDVTQQVLQERAHSEAQRERKVQGRLLEHMQRVSKIGAWRYHLECGTIDWSDEVYNIYELPVQSEIDLEQALSAYCPESRIRVETAINDCIEQAGSFDVVLRIHTPDGDSKWVRTIGACEVLDGRPHRLFGTFQDITAEREQHLEMEVLAKTDQLTGIGNRHAFTLEMERRLSLPSSGNGTMILCLMDLDGFKQLNDHHGHEIGDRVLKHFAMELTNAVGKNGFVARLGGDEFAAILEVESGAQLQTLISRMFAPIKGEPVLNGVQVPIGFSCGYAVFGQDGSTLETLMRHADLALYESKSHVDEYVTGFDASMAESHHRRFVVTEQFDQAITDGQIVPFYQPVIELNTGRLSGLEALARWRQPDGTIFAPDKFMEVFNNPRICVRLGKAMLERVCRDMSEWKSAGIHYGRVGFNVTGADLQQPAFSLRVLETLSRYSLFPHELVIEITETTLLAHSSELVLHQLQQLRDAGVSVALDDFGTGYSSLTHLQNLDFDILKLDKSFVRDLAKSNSSRAIVTAMIGLGEAMGYSTVAEGIEDSECRVHLADMGCERGQGYFFSRPQARADIERFLAGDDLQSKTG